jgi:hypothetical protein
MRKGKAISGRKIKKVEGEFKKLAGSPSFGRVSLVLQAWNWRINWSIMSERIGPPEKPYQKVETRENVLKNSN